MSDHYTHLCEECLTREATYLGLCGPCYQAMKQMYEEEQYATEHREDDDENH